MSSSADVQHAVHEAGQSEECFQCPFLSSPKEFGKTTLWTQKTEGLPGYKKNEKVSAPKLGKVPVFRDISIQMASAPRKGAPRKS